MSIRAAVDCDRCRKRDVADYQTITVDTENGESTRPGPSERFLTLHLCGS